MSPYGLVSCHHVVTISGRKPTTARLPDRPRLSPYRAVRGALSQPLPVPDVAPSIWSWPSEEAPDNRRNAHHSGYDDVSPRTPAIAASITQPPPQAPE